MQRTLKQDAEKQITFRFLMRQITKYLVSTLKFTETLNYLYSTDFAHNKGVVGGHASFKCRATNFISNNKRTTLFEKFWHSMIRQPTIRRLNFYLLLACLLWTIEKCWCLNLNKMWMSPNIFSTVEVCARLNRSLGSRIWISNINGNFQFRQAAGCCCVVCRAELKSLFSKF